MASSDAEHLAGLTSASRAVIDAFFRWSQLSLNKFTRNLDVEAMAYATGNLLYDHYSKDDVRRMLDGQRAMLQTVVHAQLESATAASAELMRAVLRDADRQRVQLNVDAVGVLGDAGGVGAMGAHGRQLLSGPSGRLVPLTVADAGGEAARQLAEANEAVQQLRDKLRRITDEYTRVMNSRSRDAAQLRELQSLLQHTHGGGGGDDDATQAQRHDAHTAAAGTSSSSSSSSSSDEEVAALRQTAVQLRCELQEARRELATRLHQSTQFRQMQKLLALRNTQVRTLLQRLAGYEPDYRLDGGAAGDDIVAEDD